MVVVIIDVVVIVVEVVIYLFNLILNVPSHSFYVKWLKYENTLSHACKIFVLHDMLRYWVLFNSSNACLRFLT